MLQGALPTVHGQTRLRVAYQLKQPHCGGDEGAPCCCWIASRSLSSGAHSRDPLGPTRWLASNDDQIPATDDHISDSLRLSDTAPLPARRSKNLRRRTRDLKEVVAEQELEPSSPICQRDGRCQTLGIQPPRLTGFKRLLLNPLNKNPSRRGRVVTGPYLKDARPNSRSASALC